MASKRKKSTTVTTATTMRKEHIPELPL